MSFGYSVGDVINGANLTYRLLRIMADSKGGSQEYIDAMSELSAMQQAFLQISHIRSQKMLPTSTINAASHIVLSSIEIIAAFLERSKQYKKMLENPRASRFQSSWYKAGWMLYKSHELRALRDTLHAKLTSVQLLLSAAAYSTPLLPHQVIDDGVCQMLALPAPLPTQNGQNPPEFETQSKSTEIESKPDVSQSSSSKEDLDQAVQAFTKESEAMRRIVKFKDAVGRSFKFPFDACNTWDGMKELIKQAFIQVPTLGPHIQAGHYDLTGPDGTTILPAVWGRILEPGMSISMTIWPMEDTHRAPTPPPSGWHPRNGPPPRWRPLPPPPPGWSDPEFHPNNYNNPSPQETTMLEEEAMKRLKQLGSITKPALLKIIRDMTEESLIPSENSSSLIDRLRSLRPGTMAELIEVTMEELADLEEGSVIYDSGSGNSIKSETSSRIVDSSDEDTGSECGTRL